MSNISSIKKTSQELIPKNGVFQIIIILLDTLYDNFFDNIVPNKNGVGTTYLCLRFAISLSTKGGSATHLTKKMQRIGSVCRKKGH